MKRGLLLACSLILAITSALAQTKLPLEVVGPAGYTQSVTFSLQNASQATTLYLKVHRGAYRDASVNAARGAKASLRLNSGAWIDLTNETVDCYDHEAAYGCLNGAYHTVRLKVALATLGSLQAGNNTLTFRFNGTDGLTSGYRILEFNLLNNAGSPLLAESSFTEDDPATWQPPLNTTTNIAEGKRLWQQASLRPGDMDRTIKATCGGCHTRDGADLKYFNFSNHSIQERAKFHGLSDQQAQQIASYIRSLTTPAPAQARPWTPPYQPGPGLDSRPIAEWAAGAGLDWVLEQDEEMLPYLFSNGTSQQNVDQALSVSTPPTSHRELPVAIQFPDWLDWLPGIHPVDVLGEEAFYNQVFDPVEKPLFQAYQDIHDAFDYRDYRGWDALNFFTGRLTNVASKLVENGVYQARGFSPEVGIRSVRHWAATKQWEVMQEYALEGRLQDIQGEEAEVRGWPTDAENVFNLSAHRTARNAANLYFQDLLVGKYSSTAWYELQVVLNSGIGFDHGVRAPVDWYYEPQHIAGLHTQANGPAHPLRLVASFAQTQRSYATMSPASEGWGFGFMHPVRWITAGHGQLMRQLDPALRTRIYITLLNNLMDLLERHEPGTWRRAPDSQPYNHGVNGVESQNYRPQKVNNLHGAHFQQRYADTWYLMIAPFREAKVDETTLNRLIDWGQLMWPNGDWDALRNTSASGNVATVRARMLKGVSDQLTLRIDGQTVKTWTISGSSYATYSTDLTESQSQSNDVRLYFADTDNATDMQVDYLEMNGTRHETEAQAVNTATYQNGSCGGSYSDRLFCQGYVDFATTVGNNARTASSDKSAIMAPMDVATQAVHVYPNPATGRLTVRATESLAQEVQLVNLQGQTVLQAKLTEEQTRLDVSALPKGLYMVRVGQHSRRVLLE